MNNPVPRVAYTYIVECSDGTFYTGWTYDLDHRLAAHNNGTGSRYTRTRRPVRLCYAEKFTDKRLAQSREWHIKKLSRAQKKALIDNNKDANYNLERFLLNGRQ